MYTRTLKEIGAADESVKLGTGTRHCLGEDIERYEVIDGVRVEREPMAAFETVLASWLCHLINSFAVGKKLGLAVKVGPGSK